jgi:hypothetical protein
VEDDILEGREGGCKEVGRINGCMRIQKRIEGYLCEKNGCMKMRVYARRRYEKKGMGNEGGKECGVCA